MPLPYPQHALLVSKCSTFDNGIQRQAEQEGNAFARFGQGAPLLLRRQQVHPADLVVLTKFALVRSFGPLAPTCHPDPPTLGRVALRSIVAWV